MKRLCLFACLPLVLCAQPPGRGPRPWFLDGAVARELNLTDAQTKQIRATEQEYRGRMFDLRADTRHPRPYSESEILWW